MKVLLITDGITPFVLGGMQKHSANLAKYLTLAGVEVTLVHCVDNNKEIPSEEAVNKVLFSDDRQLNKIIGLHFPKAGKFPGHYLKESFTYSERVYEKIKDSINEYDFVYAKGFSAWKILTEKSRGMKMPPVGVKFHGYEMFQPPPSFRLRIEQMLLKKPVKWNSKQADYVFSYGAKITDLIKEIGVEPTKIVEIPSGIDSLWLRNSKIEVNSPIRFVFLGRYERRKGVEELVNVLKRILPKENFQFHFIGPIPEDKKVQSEKVYYHGIVQDKDKLTALLDSGDVLVCPSHSEGMPNVILEGMARGMAVVATDVGAVRMLVNKDTGILLDQIGEAGLEKAMIKMLQKDRGELLSMKKNALHHVEEHFEWSNVVKKVIKHIEKVTND